MGSRGPANGIRRPRKWDHEAPQMGSESHANGITRSHKWDQEPSKASLKKTPRQIQGGNEGEALIGEGIFGASVEQDPISEDSRSHLEDSLIPFPEPIDPISETPRSHLEALLIPFRSSLETAETGSTNRIKWDQTPILPTADQSLRVLLWLAQKQTSSGLGCTSRLQRGEIAQELGISPHMVKVQISRLCKAGLLTRVNSRRGRGPSGTVFCVADSVFSVLKRDQQTGSNGISKRDQQMGSDESSSSIINNNTTTPPKKVGRGFLDQLQTAIERFGLTTHGIDANDLMKIWRTDLFTEQELLESAEHFAFYLTTDHARSIRNPKSVFISTLKNGYYAPPVGFRSWEERQAEEKLKATQARLERLREVERRQAEADFEVWALELSEQKWGQLMHGTPWAKPRPLTEPIRRILWGAFNQEREEG